MEPDGSLWCPVSVIVSLTHITVSHPSSWPTIKGRCGYKFISSMDLGFFLFLLSVFLLKWSSAEGYSQSTGACWESNPGSPTYKTCVPAYQAFRNLKLGF